MIPGRTILTIAGCSSSEKSTSQNTNESSYVFDSISPDITLIQNGAQTQSPDLSVKYYIV